MEDKKVFWNLLRADFKRAAGIPFLVAVILVVLCIAFDSWNELIFIIREPENIGAFYYYFNSLSFGGTYSGYLLPMLAALPFAASYCIEDQSNMINFIVARADKKKYCLSKILVSAISGGLVLALGGLLLVLLLTIRIPLVTDDEVMLMTMNRYPFYTLLAKGNGAGYFAAMFYLAFLRGFLYAAAALTVSAYFTNKYVTVASPFIVSFLLIRAYNLLHIPGNFRLNLLLNARAGLGSDRATLLITSAVVLAIATICGYIFMRRVIRRMEYGSHS
ncbi:MAG: hypothetical protein ACOX7O_10290 [Oscillospiraceae bacterium]|jgi:hypothetical protein